MKKFLSIMTMLSLIILWTACEKSDSVDYKPGEIPGLGDAEGELTGEPYELPDGVELTADITGAAQWSNYFDSAWDYTEVPRLVSMSKKEIPPKTGKPMRAKTENDIMYVYRGSGYGYVDLLLSLRNTNNRTSTVEFPAGLIFENVEGYCQNGVLLKKAVVEIPANTDVKVSLSFYCGNHYRGAAGSYDTYTLGVVTDAAPLIDLCERVKNKKINIEEYDPTSIDDYYSYSEIKSRLQDIVWHVTDGTGLTQEDIEYIDSLPGSR
ncbi:MAG: hypothetical protein IKM35_00545 [Bacteroidaceae bacterium]|nr:hypothetical protein [Bacteroidaceae bacterium]